MTPDVGAAGALASKLALKSVGFELIEGRTHEVETDPKGRNEWVLSPPVVVWQRVEREVRVVLPFVVQMWVLTKRPRYTLRVTVRSVYEVTAGVEVRGGNRQGVWPSCAPRPLALGSFVEVRRWPSRRSGRCCAGAAWPD